MPQILLPLSALRSTNGPSGRNPRLPFERHSAQARPPISLSKVTLEEQGAKVLFHFSYNPSFPALTLQDLAIPVPAPVPNTKESSLLHFFSHSCVRQRGPSLLVLSDDVSSRPWRRSRCLPRGGMWSVSWAMMSGRREA